MPLKTPGPAAALSHQDIEVVEEWVRKHTGLVFQEARRPAFHSSLLRLLRRARVSEANACVARLEADPALVDDLVAEITVGETYFFRDPDQFACIRDVILPALFSKGPRTQLRVWSAGCATGEEPYSLAILLREYAAQVHSHILATDLSRAALTAARRARYRRWSLRGTAEHVIQTYFEPAGEHFQLHQAIREAVEFKHLNLAGDAYPSTLTGIWGMDLIVCRNVLIYFDTATQTQVIRRLVDSLNHGGWLVLGASDPTLGEGAGCEVVVTKAGLLYRKAEKQALVADVTPPVSQPAIVKSAIEPKPVTSPGSANDIAPAPRPAAPPRDSVTARGFSGGSFGDARDPAAWVSTVRDLAAQSELAAADRACLAGLEQYGTSAELTYLHAALLSAAGRWGDSVTAARRAVYLDRMLVPAYTTLGAGLARLGDRNGARRAFGNAARILEAMPPDAIVPASDGESAGQLARMIDLQLQLLETEALA